jgi:nitrile hydratase
MQGIHDLGGMPGFAPPDRSAEGAFSEDWERQVWGLLFSLSIPGVSTGGRAAIESIPPALYLAMPYYARWLYIQEQALLASGLLSPDELADPDGPLTVPDIEGFRPPLPEEVIGFLQQDASAELDENVPASFAVGDAVVAKNPYPYGLTRMPAYVRGRRGEIHRDHGVYPFQDALPPGEPRRVQHLYSVRFSSEELWGRRGHARDFVHVDLWDDHLERPPQ